MGYLTRSGKIQTDILNDATPFAGADIAAIKILSAMPRVVDFLPRRGKAIQGTWSWNANANVTIWKTDLSHDLAGYYTTGAGAQNDEYDWPDISLPAGSYTLYLAHPTAPSYGIATLKLGATTLGTIDQYSAGQVWNVQSEINFVLAADTNADLIFIAATKNAASTGFSILLCRMLLWRTA